MSLRQAQDTAFCFAHHWGIELVRDEKMSRTLPGWYENKRWERLTATSAKTPQGGVAKQALSRSQVFSHSQRKQKAKVTVSRAPT